MVVCRKSVKNVAFNPPTAVYSTTPAGMRMHAAATCIPVMPVVSCAPAKIILPQPKMLFTRFSTMKIACAIPPYLRRMNSIEVWA